MIDQSLLTTRRVTKGLLCVDFGTAASKIAFAQNSRTYEPLAIGTRAGEGNPFWVSSAIAIDAQNKMVFGGLALAAAARGGSEAVTSFKSKLWGHPALLETVALRGGGVQFTYRDCIQAYLSYLTQLGAEELADKGASRHAPRRYAMPYAYDDERRQVRELLGQMLGRAALLSDTLAGKLLRGIDVAKMRQSLDDVAVLAAPTWLLAPPGCVGEPVAAGNFAMDEETAQLTVYMIADIGAGTTDFCILCLKKRSDGELEPIQIKNGSLSVPVAGDDVDKALLNFLVRQEAGENNRAALSPDIRTIKERLFAPTATATERLDYELPDRFLISVSRQDFLKSKEWKAIEKQLRQAQAQCFDQADQGYLQGYGGGPIRIVITGGGSALPLVRALAEGRSKGLQKVSRKLAPDFPLEVQQRFAAIRAYLPRLAVSLGGSRATLPMQDFDRTEAKSSPYFTAPYVAAPLNKTETGLDPKEHP